MSCCNQTIGPGHYPDIERAEHAPVDVGFIDNPAANAITAEWRKPRRRIQQARELVTRARALITELRAHGYDESAALVREMVEAIEECA